MRQFDHDRKDRNAAEFSVPTEYVADVLAQVLVRDVASRRRRVRCTATRYRDENAQMARERLHKERSHQGFPILDQQQRLVGVLTRRDLLDSRRSG